MGAVAPPGAYFHPGRSTSRHDGDVPPIFVVDPPPFGVGSKRFNKYDSGSMGQQGPTYHVAYNQVADKPPKWDTKGWSGMDDPIRHGRGTSSGKIFSSMAAPTGPPPSGSSLQPMFATYPNETRLQELLDLQRRKTQSIPSPGAYDVPVHYGKTNFRRPTAQALDGPFLIPEGPSTRVKEIAKLFMAECRSDIGPGDYEQALSKESTSTLRASPAIKIGQGAREGRNRHTHTLSISRSLQHGIDWHVPVIVQARVMPTVKPPGTLTAGHLQSGAASAPASAEAHAAVGGGLRTGLGEGPARYLEPQTQRLPAHGLPPAPPAHVARNVAKQQVHSPGSWNWEQLNYNYRNSWTTLHGGAYLHGDRRLQNRLAQSAPRSQQHADNTLDALFGPDTSFLDLASMPLNETAIFPIAEEQSTVFHEVHGSPTDGGSPISKYNPAAHKALVPSHTNPDLSTPVSAQGQKSPQLVPGMDLTASGHWPMFGQGGGNSPGSPRLSMTSAQDLVRHNQALQAASLVQQVAARKSQWAVRSGDLGSTTTLPGQPVEARLMPSCS